MITEANNQIQIKRVIVESPYAADTEEKLNQTYQYAKACLLDSLRRGEAPFAGHMLYPQVLDENNLEDRQAGLMLDTTWMQAADLVAVYTDLGISNGMKYGIEQASQLGIRVEFREIPLWETEL